MSIKPWIAIVIIGSAVSGCVVDGGEVTGLSDPAYAAPAEVADGADPGVLYVKVAGNGQVQLAPALAAATANGKVALAPAVDFAPEQHYGNVTMKLCGADC
ncbi:hypothetical protein J2X54_003153 [Duganella sp. 3397]|uniref:Lipoprotein n=1 Tax=Duganella phyllosphaerae TaxID=762836 RepID=A0A1E7WDU0_9BURK|nr:MULTISPECIES: hypothetical protein [Duganella]MDR7050672.1 hypothetical protein [Duganella sp. 3397]OEZ96083.1 hypothetical protein DUPY_40460 [Duganella phyllosphaerae]